MNEIIDKINETDSAIEDNPLHSELRILDWILYQVRKRNKTIIIKIKRKKE
jgi:hypothetical protein